MFAASTNKATPLFHDKKKEKNISSAHIKGSQTYRESK
jgi:hypothetical protein